MLTPWGYEVEAASLPDLITAAEFSAATGGAYDADPRIAPAIAAASAAIRAHCGWHVAPILTCTVELDGSCGDIWLPTTALRSVDSVTFGGIAQTVTSYNRSRGRVRTASPQPKGLGNVEVTYSAGYDAAATADLLDVVVNRVLAYVALSTYGISQESAGSVSITYSGRALSDAGGSQLPDDARGALQPYRLVRAHAA